MNLVIVGPSGSGKGTQAALLAKELGAGHISMGELGREEMEVGSLLGKKLARYWNAGKWAPDELVMGLLERKLAKVKGNFIFDGVPRLVEQAELLDGLLAKRGKKVEKVIYLWISDEEAVKRLSARLICPVDEEMYNLLTRLPKKGEICDKHGVKLERREDDRPEVIRSRLLEFHRTIGPVLDYYRKRGILVKVDGERPAEEIYKEILSVLT